jgi:hypothetical protein
MTAMLLLTFNSIQRPHHEQVSFDNDLVDAGLKMLDRVVEETQSEIVRSFRTTCTGLHLDAQQRCAEASVVDNCLDVCVCRS